MVGTSEETGTLEYDILSGETPALLIKQVREAIRRGWEPQGGLGSATHAPVGSPMYYQAMTRRGSNHNSGKHLR